MGYFAKIDEFNIVDQVISISNGVLQEPNIQYPETDLIGQDFIKNVLMLDGNWKQTSFNSNFRGTFAGIGYKFDETLGEHGEFVPPVVAEAPVEPPA